MVKIEENLKAAQYSISSLQKSLLNILFTAGWIKNHMQRRLKPYGLSPEQFNVLRILRGANPDSLCVKDITCKMIDRNSNTTRILDKLESKGLIEKRQSEMDRREYRIYLSEAGYTLLAQIDLEFPDDFYGFAKMSDANADELSQLLDKLRSSSGYISECD